MSNLMYVRSSELIVNGRKLRGYDLDFNINFTKESEAEIAEITIYNLNGESIAKMKEGQSVTLNAGYNGNMSNLVSGTIKSLSTKLSGVDNELTLKVEPNISTVLSKTVSKSYAPGSKASSILKDLTSGAGFEFGTLRLTVDKVYETGRVCIGKLETIIAEIVVETGSFSFIRSNSFYVVEDLYELDTGFLVTPVNGLIGSPEPAVVDDKNGYKISMLLNPLITVGSTFRLISKFANGLMRVEKGSHSGDFTTTVECLPTSVLERYVPPTTTGDDEGAGDGSNKSRIWIFLRKNGFSKPATAGAMGNLEWESGYDPNSENEIGAYGVVQWLGDRRTLLEERAAAAGKPANDLDFQLSHMLWELTDGPEKECFAVNGHIEGFKALQNYVDAAIIWEERYERAGGSHMDDRIAMAAAVLEWNGGPKSGGQAGNNYGFSADAFKCACGCGLDCVPEIKKKARDLSNTIGGEWQITSGARCPQQNAIDDGAADSLHLTGEACDGYVSGFSPGQVASAAQQVGLGTIRYSNFVHIQTYPCDAVGKY